MTMAIPRRLLGLLACGAVALAAAQAADAASITQTNLISDGSVAAPVTDPHLVNAWGMSYAPTGPWWLSDNGTGLTTVYDGTGTPFPAATPLVVTIPPAAGQTGPSNPTGQVFNPTSSFEVTSGTQHKEALFLFATENGTIAGWAPSLNATSAITAVDNSLVGGGAVYKGLALAMSNGKPFLLAANFHSGKVEVYDGNFQLVASFRDPRRSPAFSPFNVAVLNNNIYVTYARAAPGGHDDIAGHGNGAFEQVDITGQVLRRIQLHGPLNSPWGMAIAPASWGKHAGDLLVGNFGDGHITTFDAVTGLRKGQLNGPHGARLVIPGLWGLMVGNGGLAGSADDVFFTAGPNGEAGGLFGKLSFSAR